MPLARMAASDFNVRWKAGHVSNPFRSCQRAGYFLPIKSSRVTSGNRVVSSHTRRTAASEGNLLVNGRESGYCHQATIVSLAPLSQTEGADGQTTATPTEQSVGNRARVSSLIHADGALLWLCSPSQSALNRMSKRKSEYLKYLESGHWKSLKREALIRDGFKCSQCSSSENLQGHHKRYIPV